MQVRCLLIWTGHGIFLSIRRGGGVCFWCGWRWSFLTLWGCGSETLGFGSALASFPSCHWVKRILSLAVIWLFNYWDSVYTKHRLEAHSASVYLVPFIRASMFLCAELHTGLQTGVTFQHLYPKMSVVTSSGQCCFYAASALTASPRFVTWAPGLSCMFSLPWFLGKWSMVIVKSFPYGTSLARATVLWNTSVLSACRLSCVLLFPLCHIMLYRV